MSDAWQTLSLCMIVRDAERSLAQALASAQPFMDEVVVIDTGSADNTREIAQEMGARLFEFAWCDDFSAARNCSLQQATGDWIFWMDADDVLPATSGKELHRVIAEHPARDAAFWVTVEEEVVNRHGRSRVMGHAHVKLFPRHPQIRFRYRIHEQVAPSIRDLGLPLRRTGAVVHHAHADRSAGGEQARSDRNLRLALLDLQERPDDPFVWLSVGTTYLFRPDGLPAAIDFLRRSVAAFNSGSQNQLNALLYLGQALGTSGQRQDEEQVYRQALEAFPNDAVLLMRLANLCEVSGRLQEAAENYQALLRHGRTRVSTVHVRDAKMRAALRLGRLYERLGMREREERPRQKPLKGHSDAAPVVRSVARSNLDPASKGAGTSAMTPGSQNFAFLLTAYNVRPFLDTLVASLANQRWTKWKAVFVDDCSTDGTPETLRSLIADHRLTERFQIIENRQRRFQACNLYHAIKSLTDRDEVVVIVDGDDHLAVDDALDRLAREYDRGWEVVWSNWQGSDGSRGSSSHLNPFISPRRQPFVSSHLLSFKRRLFDAVTESDLQDDSGQWFQGACDVAVAWPVLDQTIKRKHIEDVLYIYNRDNPLCSDWSGQTVRTFVTPLQARDIEILRRRPAKALQVDQQFLCAHLYEFLRAAAISQRLAVRHEISAALDAFSKNKPHAPEDRKTAAN